MLEKSEEKGPPPEIAAEPRRRQLSEEAEAVGFQCEDVWQFGVAEQAAVHSASNYTADMAASLLTGASESHGFRHTGGIAVGTRSASVSKPRCAHKVLVSLGDVTVADTRSMATSQGSGCDGYGYSVASGVSWR